MTFPSSENVNGDDATGPSVKVNAASLICISRAGKTRNRMEIVRRHTKPWIALKYQYERANKFACNLKRIYDGCCRSVSSLFTFGQVFASRFLVDRLWLSRMIFFSMREKRGCALRRNGMWILSGAGFLTSFSERCALYEEENLRERLPIYFERVL